MKEICWDLLIIMKIQMWKLFIYHTKINGEYIIKLEKILNQGKNCQLVMDKAIGKVENI